MFPMQVTPEVASGPTAISVIVLYFMVMVGVGLYFYNKSRESVGDFWIAGGQIPEYVQVFAYLAVLASAGSFFGIGGLTYNYGIGFGMVSLVGLAGGGLFAMIFLAGPIRRSGVYTVPDYLSKRYKSNTVRLVGAIIFTISSWAYLVPQLTAGGITMEFVLPQIGYETGLVTAAVVFALYVSLGGMWAVTWTDFIQGIMMFLLALVPVPLVLLEFGSPSSVISAGLSNAPELGGTATPGLMMVGVGVVWLLAPLGLPQMGQRMLSSESDKAARGGLMWGNALLFIMFTPTVFLLAMAAMAIEPNLANGDYYYYAVLSEFAGPVLQGLGAAGLLAAIMSTTDALLIALSASVSHDLPETFNLDLTERQETILGMAVIWIGALSASVIAFDPPAIIGLMTTLVAGGAASGLFPALAIGTWWKRANKYGALSGMIVGFGSYGVLLFGNLLSVPYTEVLVAVPAGVTAFIVGSLVTRKPTSSELEGFVSFHTTSTVESTDD